MRDAPMSSHRHAAPPGAVRARLSARVASQAGFVRATVLGGSGGAVGLSGTGPAAERYQPRRNYPPIDLGPAFK